MSRTGPLEGVRVLEMGSFIAGPFAGQLLGDFGAEVVKIETPGGDPMRQWGITTDDGDSYWWPTIARNKRSVTADLKSDQGRELVRRLAADADVVLENFKPGRIDAWGLDYESISALNPRVIYTHVSGFGQTGPRSAEGGFGSIGEAMGGIRHTTGEPDRPAARCGISLGDSLAASFAVMGTLAALHERQTSGRGQEVDVAIYEAVAALMESTMADYELAGVRRERTGGVLKGVAPANAYPTADGGEVLIAGNADSIFRRLCAEMGQPELAQDPRFAEHLARGEHLEEIDQIVAQWTSTIPSDELIERLNGAEVPVGRVYTAPDMLADTHYAARDMILRHTSKAGFDLPMTGIVPRFSRTPGSVRQVGPTLGEHTAAVEAALADGQSPWAAFETTTSPNHFERSHSILIDASPETVLDYVSNPNTWPEWITTHHLEADDRPLVKGDTFREFWVTRKGDAVLDWTVLDSSPGRFWLGQTHASFIGPIQVRYDVETVDAQTRFTRTMINPDRPKPPTQDMIDRMDAEATASLEKIKANTEARS